MRGKVFLANECDEETDGQTDIMRVALHAVRHASRSLYYDDKNGSLTLNMKFIYI